MKKVKKIKKNVPREPISPFLELLKLSLGNYTKKTKLKTGKKKSEQPPL